VEAKRTRKDATVGQQQAKLYADCLQAQYGQRPIIFYSNGYEHWMWDDASYPPRSVQGLADSKVKCNTSQPVRSADAPHPIEKLPATSA